MQRLNAQREHTGWMCDHRRKLLIGVCVPLAFSVLVHAGLGVFMKAYEWLHAPRRLADVPSDSSLLLIEPPLPAPPEPTKEPPSEAPPPVLAANEVPVEPELPTQPTPPPPEATFEAPASSMPAVSPAPEVTPPPSPPRSAIFAGVKSERADRVVYVVDASGPMASSLAFVLDELSRSIEKLDASQSFEVVLFRQLPDSEVSAGYEQFHAAGNAGSGLVPANRRNKDAVQAWLRTFPAGGKSVPLAGLRAALELKPDLVYLLTRSIRRTGPGSGADSEWGSGRAEVLATLDGLNPQAASGRRPTIIKAIQFIDDDPSGLLKAIASVHGDGPGAYAVVKLEDLTGR